MGYVIVTDSGIDLTQKMIAELELVVGALKFTIEGKTYEDRSDKSELSTPTFYNMLREGKTSVTTQINTEEFKDLFEPILKKGEDVLYIGFSGGLSGTYQSACIAADELREMYPERKLYTVDSLCASMGQGLLVDLAVQEQRKGKTIEEVRDYVEATKGQVHHWVTVGNLTQLRRGGRLSATKAIFGSLLQVKPIIQVDAMGRLVAMGTVKGRKKALAHLIEQMEEFVVNAEGQRIYIVNSDCSAEAEKMAEEIKAKFPVAEVIVGDMGQVIGSHTGKDTIGLFFLGQERTAED